ncbi:S-locus-specific glycoprotein BS29-2-like [Cornus florida]|uniref:S-locus-specific glycoprotein BS29-2-like n=1 Tax=Cornus florida TaxID=4283 RepID=UPI0028A1E13F|nr:S-locus-specific glycoprotein BS29-2-like [Cornus florida]
MGKDLNDDLERHQVSWRSADDPSPGDFSYRIDNHGMPRLYSRDQQQRHTGLGHGMDFDSPVNYSAIARLTLNHSGFLQYYSLNKRSNEWSLVYQYKDQCDSYGQCGAYGICSIHKSPIRECLHGFTPKLQQDWQLQDWSSGCMGRTTLDCQSDQGGFLKVEKVKLPDLLD